MEKLYMQDSQKAKKQKKKGLQTNVSFSVALSVVVAAFALFSIASFGIINNQNEAVSYAAPTSTSFTLVTPDLSTDIIGIAGYTDDMSQLLNVPMYYADTVADANRVYCSEIHVDWENGSVYNQGDLASDAGLVYILNNSFANGVRVTDYRGNYADQLEQWVTQAAIWLYLADKYPTENKYKFYAEGEKMESTVSTQTRYALEHATKFLIRGGTASSTEIDVDGVPAKVQALVNAAKNASSTTAEGKVSISASEEISKTSDGKYYQTGLVSVVGTPTNSMVSYNITKVDGIEGVKIVDENGNDLALTNIPAGKKFYARIPVDKVTGDKQTLQITVVGNFNMRTGVYYVSDGKQTLIRLEDSPSTDEKGIEFDIVGAPDTGMNAAQTIYFIGLIVLLCGVGIVYANTKPVESKQ